MSTKAQLREAIKREGRIKASTNLDQLVDDIVEDIMRDLCNKDRYHELLQEGEAITLVEGQQAYTLPADYQNLDVVRYGRGPDPTTFRVVELQSASVRQTWSGGYPRFYRLIAGPKISFWPFDNIVAADQLLIDYYVDPASLYTLETSPFPVPRLEGVVKKAAIMRVLRFSSVTEEAQLTDRDSEVSLNAARSAS